MLLHEKLKEQNQKMTWSAAVEKISFLSPDIALVHATWKWLGFTLPSGEEAKDFRGIITGVMVKQDGKWLIRAFHNTLASAPPTPKVKNMVRYVDPTEQLVAELAVRDLSRSVSFYRALGFDLLREETRFAVLAWEGHQLFLQQTDNLPEPAGPAVVNLRVMVPDVDRLWQRATELGSRIIVPIGDRRYGLRDFTIADPDGYELRFATRLPAVGEPEKK